MEDEKEDSGGCPDSCMLTSVAACGSSSDGGKKDSGSEDLEKITFVLDWTPIQTIQVFTWRKRRDILRRRDWM